MSNWLLWGTIVPLGCLLYAVIVAIGFGRIQNSRRKCKDNCWGKWNGYSDKWCDMHGTIGVFMAIWPIGFPIILIAYIGKLFYTFILKSMWDNILTPIYNLSFNFKNKQEN